MKRLTVTEPSPGLLQLKVSESKDSTAHVLTGSRFSVAEVSAWLEGMGVTPTEEQLATIRRVLGQKEGA